MRSVCIIWCCVGLFFIFSIRIGDDFDEFSAESYYTSAQSNSVVLHSLLSLDCLTRILAVLMREASGMSRVPQNVLSEWATESGVSVCESLGQLQRYAQPGFTSYAPNQ